MPLSTRDALAFVRAIHAGNYDAAGPFADWLEEQDDPAARRRGVLLRRRWKRYQKEREAEIDRARARERAITEPLEATLAEFRNAGWEVSGGVVRATIRPTDEAALSFRRYVQRHFFLHEYARELDVYLAEPLASE